MLQCLVKMEIAILMLMIHNQVICLLNHWTNVPRRIEQVGSNRTSAQVHTAAKSLVLPKEQNSFDWRIIRDSSPENSQI